MIIDINFLENLSHDLKRIVLDASQAIMDIYEKNTFDTKIKSDGSPVTEADENANKIIIQSLNIISPDISIVSEETYDKSDEIPNEPYWLVDPLDGTKEFINKSKDFTVNIALIKESEPVYGLYALLLQVKFGQDHVFKDLYQTKMLFPLFVL
jgi:3'(2'), 5'-bisphosphate nucleotidase